MKTRLWRATDGSGLEYFEGDVNRRKLRGTVLLRHEGAPLRLEYRISCDAQWDTRHVQVELRSQGRPHVLELTVDEQQRWWREGEELRALEGFRDVDLSFSPSTNWMPIRRLGERAGAQVLLTAAWVVLPELSVEPLEQRYTRLTPNRVLYESVRTGFRSELETDPDGLVTSYPGGWELLS
jgi:uncharacterized protein